MITKNMELLDIVENYPQTESFFHLFDKPLGHCILCENLFENLENLSKKYPIDLNLLIENLNIFIKK
jgi:hypothetical protein